MFDLKIYDAEGREIQPEAPVTVTVDFGRKACKESAEYCAVHFPATGLREDGTVERTDETAQTAKRDRDPGRI